MNKHFSFILVGAAVAAPISSDAWMSYCRAGTWGHASYGQVGWGGACCPGGWDLSPGTVAAAGIKGLLAPGAPVGSVHYSLPPGAQGANIKGVQYYVADGVYYRPYFGSNGVYYQVVGSPI